MPANGIRPDRSAPWSAGSGGDPHRSCSARLRRPGRLSGVAMEVSAHALRYFLAVGEERHFGRAAARLHLTTPSLSEQVTKLEKRLGAGLFVRSPPGVQLTRA